LNRPTDFFELADACKIKVRTDSAARLILRAYGARATSTEHGPYHYHYHVGLAKPDNVCTA
ncbi:MAG: hypothetical protein WAM52_22575, partial [Steroidobacteraceae bacterium]